MINFSLLIKIKKDAIQCMKKGSDDLISEKKSHRISFVFFFTILPIVISIISIYLNIRLSDFRNFIATGIAIFIGLFFSLLLTIGGKIRTERNNRDMDLEQFKSYRNNMKQIASIILYIIQLGLLIFITIFIDSVFLKIHPCYINYLSVALVSFFMSRFLVSIIFMIQKFYYTNRDEISNLLYKPLNDKEDIDK